MPWIGCSRGWPSPMTSALRQCSLTSFLMRSPPYTCANPDNEEEVEREEVAPTKAIEAHNDGVVGVKEHDVEVEVCGNCSSR